MATGNNNRYGANWDEPFDARQGFEHSASAGDSPYSVRSSQGQGNRVQYHERAARVEEELRYANDPAAIGNASFAGYNSEDFASARRYASSEYSNHTRGYGADAYGSRGGYDDAPRMSSAREGSGRSTRQRDAYSRDAYGRDAYGHDPYGRDASSGRTRNAGDARGSRSGRSRSSSRADQGINQDARSARSSRSAQRGASSARSRSRAGSGSQLALVERGSSSGRDHRVNQASDRDAVRYSREYSERTYAQKAKRKKATKRKIVIGIIIALAALILIFGGTIVAYVQTISKNLSDGVNAELRAALVDTQYKDDPFYMLLLGIDKSEARVAEGDWGDDVWRTDSMMLVRVDPKGGKVTMVSLLRDTLLNMSPYGNGKINEAYSHGGAAFAVEVVSKFAGVDISHYAEIDFEGFQAMVDALGGVEVDVPITIDDPEAGGHLDKGLQTLDGYQALILCRSRHAYDQYGAGDMYRASNQRVVLSAVAQKLLSADILTIAETATALSNYVMTDLSISDIVGYAQVMRGIDASTDIFTATEPTGSIYIDYGWYEYVKKPDWVEMMTRINNGLPPTETSQTDATGTVLANAGGSASASGGSTTEGNATSTQGNATSTQGNASTTQGGSESPSNVGTASTKRLDWSRFNGYDYYEYAPLGSPDGVTGNVYGESGLIF